MQLFRGKRLLHGHKCSSLFVHRHVRVLLVHLWYLQIRISNPFNSFNDKILSSAVTLALSIAVIILFGVVVAITNKALLETFIPVTGTRKRMLKLIFKYVYRQFTTQEIVLMCYDYHNKY